MKNNVNIMLLFFLLICSDVFALEKPVIIPGDTSFVDTLYFYIVCPDSVDIYLTTDGSTPYDNSYLYQRDTIPTWKTTIVSAIAFLKNNHAIYSEPISVCYTQLKLSVKVSPESKEFTDSLQIRLYASEDNAEIWYTLDGSTPDSGQGLLYSDFPIIIKKSIILKAITCKTGFIKSDVIIEEYIKTNVSNILRVDRIHKKKKYTIYSYDIIRYNLLGRAFFNHNFNKCANQIYISNNSRTIIKHILLE